jgi:hypothetical protein
MIIIENTAMRLHQLIPVLKSVKQATEKAITEIYHKAQKADFFSGLSKTYTPRDDEGFVYPGESKPVTLKTTDLIARFAAESAEVYDLALMQDCANTEAFADVLVNGQVLLAQVPVTHLLFLESQLVEVKTFLGKLQVLPIDKEWTYSSEKGCYVTPVKETVKSKKATIFQTVADATEHHPAQVREVSQDINEGTWKTQEYSSALPGDRQKELLRRVDVLIRAVIQARQEANLQEISPKRSSDIIFGYLFGE